MPRAAFALVVAFVVADAVLGLPVIRRIADVMAVLVLATAATLATVAAGHVTHTHERRWHTQALGALGLMLAAMARLGGGSQDDVLVGVFLVMSGCAWLAAAVVRVEGPRFSAQAVRLLADSTIVAATCAVATLLLFERAAQGAMLPPLVVGAFAAAGYAVVSATRVSAMQDPGGADSLFLGGVVLSALYAGGVVAQSIGFSLVAGLGSASVVMAAGALLAWSSWRCIDRGDDPDSRWLPDTSRLRFAPAVGAGATILLLTALELTGKGSRSTFVGVILLFALIVVRLVFTLLENRRLLAHLQRSDVFEENLRHLGAALVSAINQADALQLVCRTAQTAFGAHAVVLWMVDHESGEIEAVEVVGPKRSTILQRRMQLSDPVSLAARVARTGESEVIRHVSPASPSNGFLNVLLHAQSLLAVPIARGPHVQGVIVCTDASDPTAYGSQEQAKGELLAAQVAVALDNAYQHDLQRRRLEEVTALHEFAQSVHAGLSNKQIAGELLPILKHRLRYTYASVWLRDGVTGMLRYADGDSPGGVPMPASRVSQLAQRAFSQNQPAHAGLGWAPPTDDWEPSRSGIKSQIAVPMTVNNRVIGVVDLESKQPNAYSLHDERLIVSLASHAALAIENLRLAADQRKLESLRELDRMKSELLSTVSHELRTPLGSIKGYATTLLAHEHRLKREERREFLGYIDSEADRLTELIENLLDLSRLEGGLLRIDRQVARLGPTARDVTRKVQLATEMHEVELEWPMDDPEVHVDTRRIYQVMQNLISNAVKYAPRGGRITLSGQVRGRDLLISVRDEGLGIPPGELDRIFDRFHRVAGEVSRRIGGTGLGLAICKALVDAHGGSIWAESDGEGFGSTFRFTLPLAPARVTATTHAKDAL